MTHRIQSDDSCTRERSFLARRGNAPTKKRKRPRFRRCCGEPHRMVAMAPCTARALLLASLLSCAVCFPCFGLTKTKTWPQQPERATTQTIESRSSVFDRTDHGLSPRHVFLPEVFVLSLCSASQRPTSDRALGATKKKNARTNANRESSNNQITIIETVDDKSGELPPRTIEYRRRKHEWADRYTSQEGLREAFGSNRNRWWGDLDAKTARILYKKLLFPTALSELVLELGDEIIRPEELAPLAFEARKAAKMYVRERCRVPSRVGAYLFDGFRQLRRYGRFQPNGVSYEQLWIRYYEENNERLHNMTDAELEDLLRRNEDYHDNGGGGVVLGDGYDDDDDLIDETDDAITEEEIVKRTCQKIIEKSCTTNAAIDQLCLKGYDVTAATRDGGSIDAGNEDNLTNGKKERGPKRRKKKSRKDRYNEILLKRITKTLERDVRKLLEPLPTIGPEEENAIYSSYNEKQHDPCDHRDSGIRNGALGGEERDWSSRRMTKQEYHCLKLFATARKHSQQHHEKGSDNPKATANNSTTDRNDARDGMSTGVSVLSPATIRKSVGEDIE